MLPSNAAAQGPQTSSSSSRGRVGRAEWGGSTASDTQGLRLSPCLLPQLLCQCPCTCPAPGPSQASLQGEKKALSVKPRKSKDVNAPLEPGDVSLFTKKTPGVEQGDLRVVSGLVRDRGCREAEGGQDNAEGTEFPSPVLLGMPRQCSEGEMLQGSSSSQLLQSRLPGPELGAAATKKVHFGFNIIKRINNYQLFQLGLTTIPAAEVPG